MRPKISYISENQFKEVGSNVELICGVENAKEKIVRWMKHEKHNRPENIILTEGVIIKNRRFALKYNNASTHFTFTLEIKNFQESDEGIYQCVIIASATSSDKAQTEVWAVKYPKIIDIPTRIESRLGQKVAMKCDVTSVPKANISWTREGKHAFPDGSIIQRGSILEINDVVSYDEGTYFCHADNGYGFLDIRNVSLIILLPPEVSISRTRIGLTINSTAYIECLARNHPPSKITWEKDGKKLETDNHRYKYTHSIGKNVDDSSSFSSLEFVVRQEEQFGYYSCVATNGIGENGREAFVHDINNVFNVIEPVP